MFNINDYCQKKTCIKVDYNKIATSGNNPHLSKAMRYAEYIRNTKAKTISPPADQQLLAKGILP